MQNKKIFLFITVMFAFSCFVKDANADYPAVQTFDKSHSAYFDVPVYEMKGLKRLMSNPNPLAPTVLIGYAAAKPFADYYELQYYWANDQHTYASNPNTVLIYRYELLTQVYWGSATKLFAYASSVDFGGMIPCRQISTAAYTATPYGFNIPYQFYLAPSVGTYGLSIYSCPNGGTLSGTTCITDASCGSANHQVFTQPPTTNLCSDGSTPQVTQNPTAAGSYVWTCQSQNGGTNADCVTDNGCAANNCQATPPNTCWNGYSFVDGTKTCVDNGCAARTCKNVLCDNSYINVPGTQDHIYQPASCQNLAATDCSLPTNYGQPIIVTSVCMAIDNCDLNAGLVNVPNGLCTPACTNQNFGTCATPSAGANGGKWKEVNP